jgi:integrase
MGAWSAWAWRFVPTQTLRYHLPYDRSRLRPRWSVRSHSGNSSRTKAWPVAVPAGRDADVPSGRYGRWTSHRLTLHGTRHTHATLLLKAGVPLHVVSRRLGHASEAFTAAVYAHVLPGQQREAAETFSRLVFGAAEGGS